MVSDPVASWRSPFDARVVTTSILPAGGSPRLGDLVHVGMGILVRSSTTWTRLKRGIICLTVTQPHSRCCQVPISDVHD
jgi:hypothetical protein